MRGSLEIDELHRDVAEREKRRGEDHLNLERERKERARKMERE